MSTIATIYVATDEVTTFINKARHRENIELVRACDEERWRTHTEESVEGRHTRETEERTTENKMERRMPTRFEKYGTESGRGDGQGGVLEERSSVIPATLHDGKSQRKRRRGFS